MIYLSQLLVFLAVGFVGGAHGECIHIPLSQLLVAILFSLLHKFTRLCRCVQENACICMYSYITILHSCRMYTNVFSAHVMHTYTDNYTAFVIKNCMIENSEHITL